MSQCACPGCSTLAKSSCSGCAIEQYCSSSCQRLDWKAHKSMCPILKKLSNKLQPYREVIRIIDEVFASKKGDKIRVLEHLLSYAEYQFGKEVPGKNYRERGGERISSWAVEVDILHKINSSIVNLYNKKKSLSHVICNDLKFPYLEGSLILLNPWLTYLDSDASNRIDVGLNKYKRNRLILELFHTEQSMAAVTMDRKQLNTSEGHCQRCLAYSRRYELEGEEKITLVLTALRTYCFLREIQGNYSDALNFAEECYNLVVVAYDPVHPQVQDAAGIMIHILIAKGDFGDAFRYAQVTYSNLRDSKNGMDQEGEEVANGSYNLADVILRQKGDLIKAEELAREALRIRNLIYCNDHIRIGISCNLLALILRAQRKFEDETMGLFERSLAISIRNAGPDVINVANVNMSIGEFYHQLARMQSTVYSQRTQLLLAKSHFEEGLRILLKIHGPTHPETVDATSQLANILRELS